MPGDARHAPFSPRAGAPRVKILARLLFVGVAAGGLAHADDIVLVDGSTVEGVRVESESIEEVKYRRSGGRGGVQTVASSEVRTITYSSTTPDFREGMKKLLEGETLEGAGLLAGAASDDRLDPHERATALVTAAEALIGFGGDAVGDARGLYNELLTEFPKTRHLPRALLGRSRAELTLRQYDAAIAGFEKLKSDAAAKGYGKQWEMQSTFFALLARQAKGGGNTTAIRDGYAALKEEAEAAGDESIAMKCALQLGRLNLQADDFNRALPAFNDIIAARLDVERDVAAGAYLGRGRVLFALAEKTRQTGDAEGAADDFKAALLDFLRVHTHYADVQESQAEAIYWARLCFENLGGPQNAREAAILRARLKSRYPGSPWTARVD